MRVNLGATGLGLKVRLAAALSSILTLGWFGAALAHAVQPTVADLTIDADRVTIELDWIIEAPAAGIDLSGIADTNDAPGAARYDALRALPPDEMEGAFRAAWDDVGSAVSLAAGGEPVPLSLGPIEVPEVGNPELARISSVTLTAPLPPGDGALTLGWEARLGPVIVRQIGVEDGFAQFLASGGLSDGIPRATGDDRTAGAAFARYVGVGFDQIAPLGLDHILFVLGLFFLAARPAALLWQVTAFTLAHTVTLVLGALGILRMPAGIVEPLIAASIVYVALENLLARGLTPWRPACVFAFGLVHGLGFASALSDFGLGAPHFAAKLVGFSIGVEIGQLAVIAAAFIAIGWLFGRHDWYRMRLAAPVSFGIAVIALYWVLERTGTVTTDGVWGPMAALTEGRFPVLWGAGVALGAMLLVTLMVFLTDSDALRDWGGFATSLAACIAVTGAFAALDYGAMAGLVIAWMVTIRAQSIGGLDDGPENGGRTVPKAP